MDKTESKKKKYRWYDLHFFGLTINPWFAVIFGLISLILGGTLGQALKPIGLVLLILGAIKITTDMTRKKK